MYRKEASVMTNPQRPLELRIKSQQKKRDLGILGERGKAEENGRRNRVNRSSLGMACFVDWSPSLRHYYELSSPLPDTSERDITTNRNLLCKYKFPFGKEKLAPFLELFLPLMVLYGLQVEIIHMPKRHILGWHILVPLSTQKKCILSWIPEVVH